MADQPQSEIDEAEVARWNRLGAEHEIQYLIAARGVAIEQASSMAKWLLASLLTINGAGALATINMVDKIMSPLMPGAAFIAGMMLPLAAATIIQNQNFAKLKPVNETLGYWLTVVDDGERVDSLEQELLNKAQAAGGPEWLSQALGWLSACLFIIGAASLGQSAIQKQSALTPPNPAQIQPNALPPAP